MTHWPGFPESDPGAQGLHAAWYAANRDAGRPTAQRCSCGVWRHPARYRCPACHGDRWEFAPFTPEAEVVSWTVTRRPVHFGFVDAVPYGIVVAQTPEGVRMLLQLRPTLGERDVPEVGERVDVETDSYGVPFAVRRSP